MTTTEHVRAVLDLDVKRTEGIVEGLAARWDTPYRVSDDGGQTFYEEVWRQGAATKSIRERKLFELRFNHDGSERVGSTEFFERSDGLRFEAHIEEDQEQLRQAAADGDLTDVSIRFLTVKEEMVRSDRKLITEAKLRELSLVQGPPAQYADAKIESARQADEAAEEILAARKATRDAALEAVRRAEALRA